MILLIGLIIYGLSLPIKSAQQGSLTIYLNDPGSKVALYAISDPIDQIDTYLKKDPVKTMEQQADENGTIRFASLPDGYYIVVQTQSSSDKKEFVSHIVTIPTNEQYDLEEYPKVDRKIDQPDLPLTQPDQAKTLPYTGTLQWLILLFASVGVLCIVFGMWIRKYNEKT